MEMVTAHVRVSKKKNRINIIEETTKSQLTSSKWNRVAANWNANDDNWMNTGTSIIVSSIIINLNNGRVTYKIRAYFPKNLDNFKVEHFKPVTMQMQFNDLNEIRPNGYALSNILI